MSIANLLVPNNYNLFAESITVNNQNIPNPIVSATYTPILTISNGIIPGTVAPLYASYFQIGNQVFVSIKLTYTITSPISGRPIIDCTIPVPRTISGNFVGLNQASGPATSDDDSNAIINPGLVESNNAFQTVRFTWSISNAVSEAGAVCRACLNFSYFI